MRRCVRSDFPVGLALMAALTLTGCDGRNKPSASAKDSNDAKLPPAVSLRDTPTSSASATLSAGTSDATRPMTDEFAAIEIDKSWASVVDANPRIWSGGILLARTASGPVMISVGAASTKGTTDRVALTRVRESARTKALAELAKFMNNKVTTWSKEQTDTVQYREAVKQDTKVDHSASASISASVEAEAYVNDEHVSAGASSSAAASETYKQRTKVDHALSITKELFQKTEFTMQEASSLIRGATEMGSWRSKDGSMVYSVIVVTKEAVDIAKDFLK